MPILKEHNRWDESLGSAEDSRVEGNKLIGKLRFDIGDGADGQKAFGKVERGHTKFVSVGYRVYSLRYISDGENGLPNYMATDWEPMEISTAKIPADIKAAMRTDKDSTNKLTIEQKSMETQKTPEQIEQERIAAEAAIQKRIDDAKVASTDTAIQTERTRVSSIIQLGERSKMKDEFVREHIAQNTSLEGFRALVLEKLTTDQPTDVRNVRVVEKFATLSERNTAMVEGILVRMNGKKYEADSIIKENPFRHRTLLEITDEFYQSKGGDMSLSPRQRVAQALMISTREVGMSTSDLPNLFANVLHKILRKEYKFQTGKWQQFCYNQPATRINTPEKSIKLGDFDELSQVTEGAEYKAQSIADTAENFTVRKYGSTFFITIEMIINDDLGGMERLGMKAAKADAFTEDYLAWAAIQSNPTMSDGKAVFSSAHANIASGSALSLTSLSELWLKITTQKGDNNKPLDIDPKFIITGRSNQAALDQILNPNLMPITPGDAVQSYIKLLTPIYTNYISDNRFYLAADPSDIDTLRFGGLVGEPDFALENYYEPGRDAWAYKMRKYFGIAFTEYRGLAFNPGV